MATTNNNFMTPKGGGGRPRGPDVIDLTRPTTAFQPLIGAKKIVIKNLRQPNAQREAQIRAYYDEAERMLEEALTAILAGGEPSVPLERLYRSVEDLCRKGNANKVYTTLRGRMESHVQRVILPRVVKSGEGTNLNMARHLLAEWQSFNQQMVGKPISKSPGLRAYKMLELT